MSQFRTWRGWLRGLLAAIISGIASGAVLVIVAPETFNIHGGLQKLLTTSAGFGIYQAALYLKQSPLPDFEPEPVVPEDSKKV